MTRLKDDLEMAKLEAEKSTEKQEKEQD